MNTIFREPEIRSRKYLDGARGETCKLRYIRVPLSKSFAECSQDTFNRYFEAASIKLNERAGYDVVATYLDWMKQRDSRIC